MKPLKRRGDARELADLVSVGPATLEDFEALGVRSVEQLARMEPARMYECLCRIRGVRLDICVLDVFSAAVAQASDPDLPAERGRWWWWSRRRKTAETRRAVR